MVKRVKTVQESDLRMLGSLARNIQRVLPVTQADIDAAAALGKGWVVWKVFEVSDPLDNLRGGTQLVIRQNSIQPGQNVRRVIFVVGPGGQTVVIRGTDYIVLPDAIANSLSYVKAFGGTEQRNIPQPYTQVNYVTNTAQTAVDTGIMIDFAKNYEFEVECRAVSGSWYILQSRASSTGNITGIHGATSGSTITLVVGNVTVCTSAITRTVGNKLYVKATLNAGTATLYVKDETANTEDTQTGSYGTSQPNPTAAVYLLGNAGGQYVDVNSDIYMARIKENDTVVMDYVPARQVATAGFYDKATGTFKTALTPANLVADGDTVPTPDAPMDIVSNNGVLKLLMSATGTGTQSGTPTPTNPIYPVFYHQGDMILRKVGDYADSYDATTHKITRRVGVKVFDGTEGWESIITSKFYLDNDYMRNYNKTLVFCTHYKAVLASSTYGVEYGEIGLFASSGQGASPARLVVGDDNYTSVGNFKAYLSQQYQAGTPVTVWYPLATPVEEDWTTPIIYTDGTVETIEDTIGNTATAEMLLKVGDYQDVQSIIDGVVTRNVGVKVFDGTESFTASGVGWAYGITDKSTNKTQLLCTHYAYSAATMGNAPDKSIISFSSRNIGIKDSSFTTASDVSAFLAQQYQAGTPVIVVYPLETPTTESVAGQTLQVTDGDNTLTITQASLTGLELEAEYQAAVSLTIQEVQDANLDNNVTVTIQ